MKLKTKKIIKKVAVTLAATFLVLIMILLFANWKIPHDTQDYVFDNVDTIPAQKTALVLGAARYLGDRENAYFTYRIRAAKELYDAGKVKAFVVSGDNGRHSYNEPEDMRNALVEQGIPDSVIYLDYAGFRTLDSVVRMSEIFGQDSFIIVSQKFHNERAVFLAQYFGMEAYGYNAKDLNMGRFSIKTKVREKFARVKVFIDILLNKQPKFLGDTVDIDV